MININKHNIVIGIGQYAYDDSDVVNNKIMKTSPVSVITEKDCYEYYLRLKNALLYTASDGEIVNIVLPPSCIDLLSYIMCKDLDFNITYKDNHAQSKQIAEEIGKTYSAVNKIYKELKDKLFLIRTDDDLLMPNKELNNLRTVVKENIKRNGHATFDIIFKFCVG